MPNKEELRGFTNVSIGDGQRFLLRSLSQPRPTLLLNVLDRSQIMFGLALFMVSTLGCALTQSNVGDSTAPEFPNHVQIESKSSPVEQSPKDSSGQVLTVTKSLGQEVAKDAGYLITSPLRIDMNSALVIGGVAAGIGGLMVWDEDIQDFFQRNRSDAGDDAAQTLRKLGKAESFLAGHLGLIAAGWWFREDRSGDKLLQTALVSLEAQLFTEAISGLTKVTVGRARPDTGRSSAVYTPFRNLDFDRSFPSSHAARAFAVAAVFADRYEQPVPFLAYTTATLIGLSRIHRNDHWASDVFAGAALGFTIGKVLSWRHSHQNDRLTFLPYLPSAEASLGLTFQYSF